MGCWEASLRLCPEQVSRPRTAGSPIPARFAETQTMLQMLVKPEQCLKHEACFIPAGTG